MISVFKELILLITTLDLNLETTASLFEDLISLNALLVLMFYTFESVLQIRYVRRVGNRGSPPFFGLSFGQFCP
jgi:hypothetical protein